MRYEDLLRVRSQLMALGFNELAEKTKLNNMGTFTVNHLAVNGFAPVDKTCEYGTIAMPETPGIVWLDRNLGAIRGPLAWNDTSEASAGWYWQFNRKQGYKFGTVRKPNTPLPNFINENNDWLVENDPCQELGPGWRLPTPQEIMAIETWSTAKNAFISKLKLHAAGWIYTHYDKLVNRGQWGQFWSNQQSHPEWAWSLGICSSTSRVAVNPKVYGYSIRAVKDI